MATPTNFQPLPSARSAYNGVVTLGAPVAQMAMALKQLNQVKFRSAGFYHVGHSTWTDYSLLNYTKGAYDRNYIPTPSKGHTEEYDLFYFSQPTSQWIGVELIYGMATANASDLTNPYILLELYEISGGSVGTKIDEGCRFIWPTHLQASDRGDAVQTNRTNTGARLYTFPSGGLSAPTPPRPLYVPPANRGDELVLRVTAEEVVIYAVHLFDLFVEA
jgi:hypothetical protein